MKVQIIGHQCIVTKEQGDPRFSGIKNGAGESRLLYNVKLALNKQGYDLIKKPMYKDGHLVDELQYYLRTKKKTKDPEKNIYIYNESWAIEGADNVLNRDGKVILRVVTDVFNTAN